MNSLAAKAFAGFAKNLIAVGLSIFIPAGTFDFWQAWLFLIVFFVPQLWMTICLLNSHQDILRRRLKGGPSAENRTCQKTIMSLLRFFFILSVLVPGLNRHFAWTHISSFIVVGADAVILVGLLIQFLVLQQNSFASAIIEIADKQEVVSTGLYAIVRHPMYSGALLVNLSIPIALGSWLGLPFALGILILIVLRLLDEEKFLRQNLQGYDAYCEKVPHRLIPQIW